MIPAPGCGTRDSNSDSDNDCRTTCVNVVTVQPIEALDAADTNVEQT